MKILLDNCIPGKTGKLLQEAGFSIITLKELGKSSASNSEVLYLARTNEALLLTCDLDFSNILIYPPGSHCGIIVLKISAATERPVYSVLLKALEELDPSLLSRSLVIVDKNKYRLRHE